MRFSLAATFLALMLLFVLKSQASNCDFVLNAKPIKDKSAGEREVGFNPYSVPFIFDPSGKIRMENLPQDAKVLSKSPQKQVIEIPMPVKVASNEKSTLKIVSDVDSSFTRVVRYYTSHSDRFPVFTINMQGQGQSCQVRSIVNGDHKLYDQFTCEKIFPLIKNYSQDKLEKCADILEKSLDLAKSHDAEQKKFGKPTILQGTSDGDFLRSPEFQMFKFISKCGDITPLRTDSSTQRTSNTSRNSTQR